MIEYFKSKLTSSKAKEDQPKVPKGQRVYAIGDVHGRLDLLEALARDIEAEIAEGEAESVESLIIMLGDLVDRGPDSAGVVDFVKKWRKRRDVRILWGNHEEMFVKAFEDEDVLRHFLRHGGRETLMSYGMERKAFSKSSLEEIQALMEAMVPAKHRKFISNFEDMVLVGDYLFVHAGIKPGVPLEEQKKRTLRWIREPFLSHKDPHGPVVVHGHTITDEPVNAGNRIGIDTGAYATGRLTALVLEGKKRRYIAARETKKGNIKVEGARVSA
ncbi:metallophosphoesterase family protein [Aurantiacibacter sp. D1-12]|uniref:metallophosphoesterase family protein n=1 Tax=Aurantiacibacter sp. D1-12 TaxID=2993658 RepID=UPI00237CB5F1|nr:metallophosphoesterase family protein [Aurantiacibacter sp. D1-12]MDE1467081.1 metallophosphoesterase family protein [Aurantiacibacter sp. D1-12]